MYIHKHRLESYYRPDSVTGENRTYSAYSKISDDIFSNEAAQYISTLVQHRRLFIFFLPTLYLLSEILNFVHKVGRKGLVT